MKYLYKNDKLLCTNSYSKLNNSERRSQCGKRHCTFTRVKKIFKRNGSSDLLLEYFTFHYVEYFICSIYKFVNVYIYIYTHTFPNTVYT